jgi:SMI1-KNR4 cell-wall
MTNLSDFWTDDRYFTGPTLSEEMIARAEALLGYKLPHSYLNLLRTRNGGSPRRDCFPTEVPTSWATDHIALSGIRGIGGEWGIDSPSLGSAAMIAQWGYPRSGVVVGECPSAGHDVVMLDYSTCGPEGEPRVVHVETEADTPVITVLAQDFGAFVAGLYEPAPSNEA